MNEKPIAPSPRSIPPMRNVADTGSYNLNARDLEKAKEAIAALEKKNERDLQALRDQQMNDKLADQRAVIVDLKSEHKTNVDRALKIIGFILALAATTFVGWLMGHAK